MKNYRILTKKEKNKRNTARTVHIWDIELQDTYCEMKRTHGLKTTNYWFKNTDNLPEDVCVFCKYKL